MIFTAKKMQYTSPIISVRIIFKQTAELRLEDVFRSTYFNFSETYN